MPPDHHTAPAGDLEPKLDRDHPSERTVTVPARPRTGAVLLGRYRVERTLGQGGMGVVLAVRHLELDELFAIKLMLASTADNPDGVERFLREARAAARLKGEHVARVFDVGRLEDGTPYMVMEHLEGGDLKKLVLRRGPLPVEEAVLYVLQACDAIAEAHAQGIIHRDLKPSNLLLIRRPNGGPCVKVIDFGISKMMAASDAAELTSSGAMMGSPQYMPPEQILHSKRADARSDVWALGLVLYHLVTGRVPFNSPGDALSEQPAPPSAHRPDLPAWIDAVVARCLKKPPEQRFQSIDDLAAALRSQSDTFDAPALADTVPNQPRARPPAEGVVSSPAEGGVSSTAKGVVSSPAEGGGNSTAKGVVSSTAEGGGSSPVSGSNLDLDPAGSSPPAPHPARERSRAGALLALVAALALAGLWIARGSWRSDAAPAQPGEPGARAPGAAALLPEPAASVLPAPPAPAPEPPAPLASPAAADPRVAPEPPAQPTSAASAARAPAPKARAGRPAPAQPARPTEAAAPAQPAAPAPAATPRREGVY